jgi:hypothetical protein
MERVVFQYNFRQNDTRPELPTDRVLEPAANGPTDSGGHNMRAKSIGLKKAISSILEKKPRLREKCKWT